MVRCSLIALCLVAWAWPVRADEFVIAPPWYAPAATDGEKVSDQIAALVEKELRKQYLVIPPSQAADRVAKEHRVACHGGECAERYREASHATAALVVRVHREADGKGPATSFQLGLQPSLGIEYRAGGILTEGTLEDLVRGALGEVFHAYRRGPGPFLYVTGAPSGAAVFVDDESKGVAPRQFTLSVGSHSVRIEARGYAPQTHVVVLPNVTTERKLEYRLAPARQAPSVASPGPTRETPVDENSQPRWRKPVAIGLMAGGSAALILGATYLGISVRNHNNAGDCTDATCHRRYDPENAPRAQRVLAGGVAGLGLAAVGVGVGLFFHDKRLRVAAPVGRGQAMLILKGDL